MSLRKGVTAAEEHKLKTLVSQGMSWEEIASRCQVEDDRGRPQVPLLADVDLATVKKNLYEPLLKKHEEAKKAGHKDIHSYEAKLKKDRDAAAAEKKKAAQKDE